MCQRPIVAINVHVLSCQIHVQHCFTDIWAKKVIWIHWLVKTATVFFQTDSSFFWNQYLLCFLYKCPRLVSGEWIKSTEVCNYACKHYFVIHQSLLWWTDIVVAWNELQNALESLHTIYVKTNIPLCQPHLSIQPSHWLTPVLEQEYFTGAQNLACLCSAVLYLDHSKVKTKIQNWDLKNTEKVTQPLSHFRTYASSQKCLQHGLERMK